jgi:hypothetical protein
VVVVNWGDGVTETLAYASGTVLGHVYANGPVSHTISISAVDEDGTHAAAASHAVTVNNVAPTVDAGADQTGAEGSPVTLSRTFADPASGETYTSTWSIAGPGGFASAGSGSSLTFTPPDNGVYTVTFTVNDGAASGSDSATVIVSNAAPGASVGGPTSGTTGSPLTYTASVTDAAAAPAVSTSLTVTSSTLLFLGTAGPDMYLIGLTAAGDIDVWYSPLWLPGVLIHVGAYAPPAGIIIDTGGGNDIIAVDPAVTVPMQSCATCSTARSSPPTNSRKS